MSESQPQPANLFKKRHWSRFFRVNFAKILRRSFLTEHMQCLLLEVAVANELLVMLVSQVATFLLLVEQEKLTLFFL